MKFSLKIFLGIFSVAVISLLITGAMALRTVFSKTQVEYIQRYQNLSNQIADTLIQADRMTDSVLLNALYVLREIEEKKGLPSNTDLMRLKGQLGVSTFYITDR